MAEEKVLGPQVSDAAEVATPEEEKALATEDVIEPAAGEAEAPKKRTSRKKKEEVTGELVWEQCVEGWEPTATIVREVEAPEVEPIDDRPHAVINGKNYYIDSDNSDLLEDVAGWKQKNPETGKWEDKMFKYLPAKHIYTLMDSLFSTYDFKSEPMKWTGEEYTVTKNKYQNGKWQEVEETVRVYEKTVKIVTTVKISEYENLVRETIGYAQAVAWFSILTNDSARNGFANKLAFRARKEALKNLWKVFRTYDYEDEDTFEPEETTGVAGKSISEVAAAVGPQAPSQWTNVYNEWREKIIEMMKAVKDFFAEWAVFTEKEFTDVMYAVKADLWIDASKTVAMTEFRNIYNELKAKAQPNQ